MESNEKLISAFIYSAYDSGYCGASMDPAEKNEEKGLCEDFIKGVEEFPKERLLNSRPHILNSSNPRDYFYGGHYGYVRSQIENFFKMPYDIAVKGDMARGIALNCPVIFYEVKEVKEDVLIAENVLSHEGRELIILKGLKRPNLGDIVSGHWSHYLEVVNDLPDFNKYIESFKNYFEGLRDL